MRYSGGLSPSLEDVREGIRGHIEGYYGRRGYGLLAAELKTSGEVVGRVGLLTTELDDEADAEIHYHMAPEVWGDGLATEAARAVLRWALREGELRRVVAAIHPDNAASRRVAEKCGLRFWKEATPEDAGPLQLYVLERAGGG